MKYTIIAIMAAIVFVTGAASAEEMGEVSLPKGARICFDAVTAPGAQLDPATHPACAGVDQQSRDQITALAAQLAELRGLHTRTAATANAAAAAAKKAADDTAALRVEVEGLTEELSDVNDRVTGTQLVVTAQGEVQKATTEVVVSHDARLSTLEGQVRGLSDDIRKVEESGPRLTLRSGFVALAGLGGGDSYSGMVLAPGLSIGVAKDWRLGIEMGALAAPVAPNWGAMLRPTLSWAPVDGLSLEAAYATYGVGLNTEGDAGVLFSGLELGASKSFGKHFAVNATVMPAGLDYSATHEPKYAVGGSVSAVIRF